jgi:hypothetical protein
MSANKTEVFSEEERTRIVKTLEEKGVRSCCPMCDNKSFVLSEGYLTNTIQPDFKGGIRLGGPSIPTIAIICKKCGFMSQHSAVLLGIIEKSSAEEGKMGDEEGFFTGPEASQSVIYEALESNQIHTTEDKLRNCLRENEALVTSNKDWLTPASMCIGMVVTLCSADFNIAFLGIAPDSWRAVVFLIFIGTLVIAAKKGANAFKNRNQIFSEVVISKIKEQSIER